MLARVWNRPATSLLNWSTPAFGGAFDLYETDDTVVARVSLPGVSPDQISIQEQQGVLTIRVEHAGEQRDERDGRRFYARQLHVWERSVRLPTEVRSDRAEATMRDGVLTVKLPKAHHSMVRRIPVNGVSGVLPSRSHTPNWLSRLSKWLHWTRREQ